MGKAIIMVLEVIVAILFYVPLLLFTFGFWATGALYWLGFIP